MADSFLRRLRMLEMLKRKDDGVITVPKIKERLSQLGIDISNNRDIQRDLVFLSTILPLNCDETARPFQWWWDDKSTIDIPGMGRYSALTFKLAQEYLEPLLPKKSLSHLQPKFRQSKKVLSGHANKKERHWINKIRYVPRVMEQMKAKVSPKIETTVYDALYDEKMLQITYHSRSKDETTTRRIHPLALIYRGITTELIYCAEHETQAKRFILNRIQTAKLQLQSLQIPQDFNLDQFIQDELGFPGSGKKIHFKAWIDKFARHNVEETPLNKFQTVEPSDDGSVILTASVRDTSDLSQWILSLGARIRVIEPKTLKKKISGIAKKMAESYC